MNPHLSPSHPSLEQRRFIAQLLLHASEQIASEASQLLISRWGDIARRYNPMSQERWTENFLGRIADLAAALQAGRVQMFVDQVVWSRLAFEARGVPGDDLARSVDVLDEVLDRFLPEDDRPVVSLFLEAAGHALQQPGKPEPSTLSVHTPQGRLAAQYLLAILEGDRARACGFVVDAVRGKQLSVREAYEHVFVPVQAELGRLWHLNDLTVAEEHFATATTQLAMGQLYPYLERAAPHGKVVCAASVEGNAHDLGVRMVADYFEMAGWKAIYLGANVPAADLAMAVDHFQTHLVCLSAYMPAQLRAVEDTIRAIRSRGEPQVSCKILVGGPAFAQTDGLWREMGADGVAMNATQAVEVGGRLAGMSPA